MFKHLEDIFKKKDKAYGQTYIRFGEVFKAIFPDGLQMKTTRQFILLGLYSAMIGKCLRIANLVFKNGDPNFESVEDTCDDLSIYSQIFKNQLKENDE